MKKEVNLSLASLPPHKHRLFSMSSAPDPYTWKDTQLLDLTDFLKRCVNPSLIATVIIEPYLQLEEQEEISLAS